MKRIILMAAVILMVAATLYLWFSNSGFANGEGLYLGIIVLVLVFAVFLLVRRIKSWKAGEPQEDELTKKVMVRTAALSYYISLYLWVFLLYMQDRVTFDKDRLIGIGIVGMAIIFALSWVFNHFRGVSND
ncbi:MULTISPECIES: hypothetical protein [Algoriphagus]|uniref:DUF2178 domain-containing protein n=2 Tax=Algoriphagus TaxID=246875 RepID=A0A4Y9QS47_9BACT|nr:MULTISPECIES: hypothetical protein [Algoriphagus]MCS5490354.1 hypothetical protein [Algoriphagus limi]TFV94678.1 hypothetical protein E4S40_11765 [Algoriphagus kandeliae]